MKGYVACVTDANVWLDLAAGNLLHHAMSLPFRWMVTDFVWAESALNSIRESLKPFRFEIASMNEAELEQLTTLLYRYPATSAADLSCLVVAQRHNGYVITGDRALRNASSSEKAPVHGTVWIMEQLLLHHRLDAAAFEEALEKMRHAVPPRRLPYTEAQRVLANFSWASR